MAGKIIMWIVCFGCAALFLGIAVYALHRKEPIWFWAGVEVSPSQISDVKAYNKENAILWITYSLWYLAAGVAEIWSSIVSGIILALGGTVGVVLLVVIYNRIRNKYKAEP